MGKRGRLDSWDGMGCDGMDDEGDRLACLLWLKLITVIHPRHLAISPFSSLLESELVDGNRGKEISCFASKDSPFQKIYDCYERNRRV